MDDPRWLPMRHRDLFERLGSHILWQLLVLVRPRNPNEAAISYREIRQLRLFRFHWVLYRGMAAVRRPVFRQQVIALGYGLTTWTAPTIHDVGDALEVLVRHCASPFLVTAMGDELENWPEGPMKHGESDAYIEDDA